MEKRYLVYVDILGFVDLLWEIAAESNREERSVRDDVIRSIEEKIGVCEKKSWVEGKNFDERDSWIIATDSIERAFRVVSEVLNHNTGYSSHTCVPLEIALGTGEYDEWAKFDGRHLIVEKDTVDFLKTKIIELYHRWYEREHGARLKSSFIVATEPLYRELEYLDKIICQRIELPDTKSEQEPETAFFYSADLARVRERGKVYEFLERIGRADSKLYDRINDLYVPPVEYDDIKKALEERRFVFITGTSEYGKTYTAVRLLWEYFTKGYQPIWWAGEEDREREEVRKRLEEIESELKPHHIVYFEDPFGKTKYESRESIEREIGTIIDIVQNTSDTYVLITSREEVFKKFEATHISSKELKEFEKKLNIKKPSYDYQRREEILLRWAHAKGCKWLHDGILMSMVLRLVKKGALPTPLSIKEFVISTINVTSEEELKEIISLKSGEAARRFAREIESMSLDMILFLSFPLISDVRIDIAETEYENLVKELKIPDAREFESLIQWFGGDKIDIRGRRIVISHPAYGGALMHLLVDRKGQPTMINARILSNVMLRLSEKTDEVSRLIGVIARNFDKIEETAKNNSLLKLSERNKAMGATARILAGNFDKIPETTRNELILRLSAQNEGAKRTARIVADNFEKIQETVRNKSLLELANKRSAAWHVARAIVCNYPKVPVEVRNLLLTLPAKSKVTLHLASQFEMLPSNTRNELLIELSKRREGARHLARILVDRFDKIESNTRNEALLRLSEFGDTPDLTARVLQDHFDKVPEETRNKIMLELSKRNQAEWKVGLTVIEHFDRIPEDVRKEIILKLPRHVKIEMIRRFSQKAETDQQAAEISRLL